MNKNTFSCTQVCDAIAPDKGLWQPHLVLPEPEERDVVREEPVDVAAQSVAQPSRLVRALDGRLAVAFERLGLLPKA